MSVLNTIKSKSPSLSPPAVLVAPFPVPITATYNTHYAASHTVTLHHLTSLRISIPTLNNGYLFPSFRLLAGQPRHITAIRLSTILWRRGGQAVLEFLRQISAPQ